MAIFLELAQQEFIEGAFVQKWKAMVTFLDWVEEIKYIIVFDSVNLFTLADNIQTLKEDFNVKRNLCGYNIYCNK